jgi:cell division septation protein DedD
MASGKWAVQLGAFALLANAQALRDQVATLLARPEAEQLPAANRQPRIEFDGRLHRVLVGTFDARSTAQRDASQLRRYLARDTALYQR